ncbi:hydrogenase iron-sulfur subunit [Haloarcula marismortui]|uniref:Ferridoxin protein n=1 Tax=Haloarcula marismortui ATCC 33799 TaxID=662475 RepID=M0L0I3_9EURY|nr:hydrogenase iron-sulfur subunit [Haloarcula californiae]EMA26598.1 ferridoxin protein [Haloarcula californiae ATCC 33799]
MNTGAFVCSCGGSCDIDLEAVRDGVDDVDVVASSELLCQDGLAGMSQVIEEYDLDQVIATTPEPSCQDRIRGLADEHDLHPEASVFVDHRETSAWVHDEAAATDKTARLINAKQAGLREEAPSRTVSKDAGNRVAVVGDPGAARSLTDDADVLFIADGRDFADVDGFGDVTMERGRVVDIEGSYGEYELTLEARVTDDCIDCMDCVREGPDEMVTEFPVDIHPDAPDGEWTNTCPTDAIDLDGVTRTVEVDQVIYPGGRDDARGGRLGFYTGPVDAGTIAAVESQLGGIEKPQFLDLEMDVCAAGASSQEGCTACVDACPHGAVDRPTIDSVEFDEVACENCGACTSSCPTGATQLREPSNRRLAREVEALLEDDSDEGLLSRGDSAGIDTQVIAFVCSEYAMDRLRAHGRKAVQSGDLDYPPILPVSVNCTDTVGEAHVMHALAAGADGVAVVGCGGSCLHSGPDPKQELVDRLNQATTDLGLGDRVGFFAPEAGNPEAFVESLSGFVEFGLDETPIPAGGYEATGRSDADREDPRPNPDFDSHGWTLESVRAILDHVEPEREVIRGLKDFGVMDVNDACTLTPTCTNLCPTDAIQRTGEGELAFNHADCVNCGLCEEGCPETAITMHDGLDLSLLPENRGGEAWVTVHEGDMLECVRCGKPFTSVASADKIEEEVGDQVEGLAPDADHSVFEYCSDCRSRLLFDQGEKR